MRIFSAVLCFLYVSAAFTQNIENLRRGIPWKDEEIEEAAYANSNDAMWYIMLQAFALLKSSDLQDAKVRAKLKGYLAHAEDSFSDLQDPENLSKAFTPDAAKPYRGRPHERVMTAMMLGILDIFDNRCDLALPSLRNAEFLDARWQAFAYGTDAPLVYALMLRCLYETHGSHTDRIRALEGLEKSMRLLMLQEPILDLFRHIALKHPRYEAFAVHVVRLIFEIGLANALMTAPTEMSLPQLLDEAASLAKLMINVLHDQFPESFEERLKPSTEKLYSLLGQRIHVKDSKELEVALLNYVDQELKWHVEHMKEALATPVIQEKLGRTFLKVKKMSQAVARASIQPKLTLQFSGLGPSIIREGQYGEIARIIPSPEGVQIAGIREQTKVVPTSCGFHRQGETLTIVLCSKNADQPTFGVENLTAVELWSSTYQAMTVVGRKFEQILKGRARFRSTTENVATVAAISAWHLFNVGTDMLARCRGKNDSICQSTSLAMIGVAGITAGIAGGVWLIGRAVNPAADPRYVPSLYESGWLLVPEQVYP